MPSSSKRTPSARPEFEATFAALRACFNFTSVEPGHVKELAALTKKGVAELERIDLPWARKRR